MYSQASSQGRCIGWVSNYCKPDTTACHEEVSHGSGDPEGDGVVLCVVQTRAD